MYFAVLGSHPELSLAEILSVYGQDIRIVAVTAGILLFDSEQREEQVKSWLERLGGTVSVGKFLDQFGVGKTDLDKIAEIVKKELEKMPDEGKIMFGLSVHDAGNGAKARELAKARQIIGMKAKVALKNAGSPVRFVTSREPILSSVIVKTNKLLENGGEFVLIASKDSVLLGKTLATQDFKAWSERDYGRPCRDPKSGMLPPKLARMLINLSGVEPTTSSLLDPFCGSGTVLMEAALMKFKNVEGSDISVKAVADTKKNLEWLQNEYGLAGAQQIPVRKESVQELKADRQYDAIVTETYLGPPMKGNEKDEEVQRVIKELEALNREAIPAMADALTDDGVLVMALPAFGVGEDWTVPVKETMMKTKFEIVDWKKLLPQIQPTANGGLLYRREGQGVGRDIIVAKKKTRA